MGITMDHDEFDCFLSHNSGDKPAARALAARLRDRGVSVWLDEEQLRPGDEWQPGLQSGIRVSKSIAVLIGVEGMGPWQDQEVQFALTLAVRDGRPVIPVLLPGAPDAPDLPQGLAIRTWVDLRLGADRDDEAGLDRLIWGIKGVKPRQAATSDPTKPPQSPPAAARRAPVIDERTWDRAHLVLRDLLVALPDWEMVPDRRAFVKAALGGHPAARLTWEGDIHTVAGNLVEKLRYFDAKPLPDGRHAVCGLLAEIHRREWDGNPKIREAAHSLSAAFGCGRG
jgi:hypothetical protein